jgi:hypothetical protein
MVPVAPNPRIAQNAPSSGQAHSAITWTVQEQQPLLISGGGLTASATSGGTHTALASRAVVEGRHYLELTLSIPPGEGGPGTWGGVGVVATSSLTHGRIFLPRANGALVVPAGRNRKLQDGDTVMLAIDLNEKLAFWGLNGEWMNGTPGTQSGQPMQGNAGEQWTPFANMTGSDRNRVPPQGGEQWIANFGANPFKYGLPNGFNSYGSTAASAQRSAATAPTPALTSPPSDALMGKQFKDVVVVRSQTVPLPTGTWTVLAHFRDPGRGTVRGDAVVLARLDGNRLLGAIAIHAHQLEPGARPTSFEACNRQDYVFRQVDTYDPQGDQRCWWINHAVTVWHGQSLFQAALLELNRRGVNPPQIMLNVAFRRANATGFATTFYYFDPTADGITSTPTSWADSEWHRSRVDSDPARRDYARKLQRWGESWSPIYFAMR